MNLMGGSAARCLIVWAGATLAFASLLVGLLPDLEAARAALTGPGVASQPFDRLFVWVCASAGLGCGVWLWTVTTLVVVEAARGSRRRGLPGIPAGLRHLVLAACGVAILGVAAPAMATPGPIHVDQTGRAGTGVVAGLPLPDRATGALVTMTASLRRVVVVRAGDTLWALAEADLDERAPDAAIAAHWHRIYDLNRAAVGSDPDVISPGLRLQLPPVPSPT